MRALVAYNVAVELGVKPNGRCFRARALFRLGMLAVTKEAFEPALAIDPGSPETGPPDQDSGAA